MGTLAAIFSSLFPSFGKVKVGGIITTLSSNDKYPTHIANLGHGGIHIYDSITDLVNELPRGRMQLGMIANINPYMDNTGTVVPASSYRLTSLPPSNIEYIADIPSYVLSDYWTIELGRKGDKGDTGDTGANGDPTLSAAFNTNSSISTAGSGNGISLSGGQIYTTGWFSITNDMSIARHAIIKYTARGYNSRAGYGAFLFANVEFSSDGIMRDDNHPSLPSWGSSTEFHEPIGGVAIPSKIDSVSVNRIPSNSTVYFRLSFTNQGGATINLGEVTVNSFLV